MLHPVLESLFLLKVARGYVSESIMSSDIEEKQELVNYIQNEASDYEVMHLVTMGEMPEDKFDSYTEAEVWNFFKKGVVMEFNNLIEDVLAEDLMTIIFETGPVSDLGYSSAAPILEFHKAQGLLSNVYLTEGRDGGKFGGITPYNRDDRKEIAILKKQGQIKAARKLAKEKGMSDTYTDTGKPNDGKTIGQRIKPVVDATKTAVSNHPKSTGAVAGAAGVAGLFGLYKLYKYYKSKKDAKGMEKVQAKIKKAKAKA